MRIAFRAPKAFYVFDFLLFTLIYWILKMSIEARQARWHSLPSKNKLGCLLSCRTKLAVSKYLNNYFKELFFLRVLRSLSLLTKSVRSEEDDAQMSLQRREPRDNLLCVHENVFSRACLAWSIDRWNSAREESWGFRSCYGFFSSFSAWHSCRCL